MKIYVLATTVVSEYEDLGTNTNVYTKKADAIEALKKWRDDEVVYDLKNGWKIDRDEQEYFASFLDGEYIGNHSEGFIDEFEI